MDPLNRHLTENQLSKECMAPSNKLAALIVLSMLSPLAVATAQAEIQTDPLLRYQGDAEIQSLYAIQEDARKFLNRERPNRNPNITVFGPDIRMQFPRCVVPLTMRWQHESEPYEMDVIEVICAKTNVKYDRSWHTSLEVFDPVAHAQYIAKQKQKTAANAKRIQGKH